VDVKSVNFPLPSEARTDPELCRIAQYIEHKGLAPAVSLGVAVRRSGGWRLATGAAGRVAHRTPAKVSAHTPFDLASLTKPFVAMAVAQLAKASVVRLSEPLSNYLPCLRGHPIARISIAQALSHRAGLRAHDVLFDRCIQQRLVSKRAMLLQAAANIAHEYQARDLAAVRFPIYSDLGYLLVGAAIENITGNWLDSVVNENLLSGLRAPIFSSRQWRVRNVNFVDVVAPTEHVPWRGGILRGVVHDENAWAWAGYGIAGHAGLFATAPAILAVGVSVIDALAGRPSPVSQFAAHFCTATREGGPLRAGFDGKSAKNSTAGRLMSDRSFGHLGFTGTSLWCDPEHEVVVTVLTNRVCPTRANTGLPLARAEIHDQLFEWGLGWKIH
jgi:CubicO group peptidase (beta-lactamase class C family)